MADADLAAALYERLKELGCPALEGVYLLEAKDKLTLLCKPSSHRLDILEWICISIYPSLKEQFSVLKEVQSDLKIKGMAKLGYELMLCQADDYDLIKGKACAQKQLRFLEQLVAVIQTQGDTTHLDSVSDSSSIEESFQEIVKKNEEFINLIFSSPDLQNVLNPEFSPWSSDVKPLLFGEGLVRKRGRRSSGFNEKTLLVISKALEETRTTLQDLKAECAILDEEVVDAGRIPDSATTLQTLKLVVSDFSQLVMTFGQVYETELQKYCERLAPRLSPCGPLFQAVHNDLALCLQELQSLAQVTETSEHISETVTRWLEEKVACHGSAKDTLSAKLEELHKKYEAIYATVQELPPALFACGCW